MTNVIFEKDCYHRKLFHLFLLDGIYLMTNILSRNDYCYENSVHCSQNCFMTTTIDKVVLRKKLLDASIATQQLLINDFKERIKNLTQTEGIGNEESYDNSDQANNSMKIMEINALNEALEFANKELDLLEKLRETQNLDRNVSSLGAIVVTNHQTFYISASLEKFTVEGQTYFGISTDSPIFKSMRGKHAGELFVHQGVTYKIKDIY